jgi:hypothetical protein
VRVSRHRQGYVAKDGTHPQEGSSWKILRGDGPLVAAAIHNGHVVRKELAEFLAVNDWARLREEEPHTGDWTVIAPTRIIGLRSRFEVDLNRPPDRAIYRARTDAWGLRVWKHPPNTDVIARSMSQYHAFYAEVRDLLEELVDHHRRIVVFDLHTYQIRPRRRQENWYITGRLPDVNVGTGTMDRKRWAPLVDRFIAELRTFDFLGRRLDVRENAIFPGGHFPRRIHDLFPDSVCVLTIEFGKYFLEDKSTGNVDLVHVRAIPSALGRTVPGILEELERL